MGKIRQQKTISRQVGTYTVYLGAHDTINKNFKNELIPVNAP